MNNYFFFANDPSLIFYLGKRRECCNLFALVEFASLELKNGLTKQLKILKIFKHHNFDWMQYNLLPSKETISYHKRPSSKNRKTRYSLKTVRHWRRQSATRASFRALQLFDWWKCENTVYGWCVSGKVKRYIKSDMMDY